MSRAKPSVFGSERSSRTDRTPGHARSATFGHALLRQRVLTKDERQLEIKTQYVPLESTLAAGGHDPRSRRKFAIPSWGGGSPCNAGRRATHVGGARRKPY